jgi:glycosyltransferase involved in cell wall biosynthesis
MFVGIPIICPDLPYARELCGYQAEYFDPSDPNSLMDAIRRLNDKIKNGWWPNWSNELSLIPQSWGEVAEKLMKITTELHND